MACGAIEMNIVDEVEKNMCCGCMSCVSECPNEAISVIIENGFYFPKIDNGKCVDCGRCVAICSARNKVDCTQITKAYIAVTKDTDLYLKSSSGGVFATIAKHYIKTGGAVVGAAILDDYHVKHIIVKATNDLEKLQGSKYVQSDCLGIYEEVKRLLDDSVKVLFSGTPCQVAALRKYLKKNYDNLLCIDIVCHGVPSPFFFEYYINKHYANKEPVKDIHFRTKDKYERYGFNLTFTQDSKKKLIPGTLDLYYRLFLKGLSFRESCYNCQYANSFRAGDITIGDCGNSNYYNSFHPDKTISTVYPITKKGQNIWEFLIDYFDYSEVDSRFEISANAQLNHPAIRNDFRDDLYSKGLEFTEKKANRWLGSPPTITRIKEFSKRIIPELHRKKIKTLIKKAL